jgi:hypothetical protein
MSYSRRIADGIEHGATAYRQHKRMPAQMVLPDVFDYRVDYRRVVLAAFTSFYRMHRTAQPHDLPMSRGVILNPGRKQGILGHDSGIDKTQYLMTCFPSSRQYRGQQLVLGPKNIPAEKDRKGILNAEVLFKRLHGKLPSGIELQKFSE